MIDHCIVFGTDTNQWTIDHIIYDQDDLRITKPSYGKCQDKEAFFIRYFIFHNNTVVVRAFNNAKQFAKIKSLINQKKFGFLKEYIVSQLSVADLQAMFSSIHNGGIAKGKKQRSVEIKNLLDNNV